MKKVTCFDDLQGFTLTKIEKSSDDVITFYTSDNRCFELFHWQDCCESVYIDDICGNLSDLIGYPLLICEESSPDLPPAYSSADSYLWTFYKMATVKGYVTIKWYGESNGYYSESVDFREVILDK